MPLNNVERSIGRLEGKIDGMVVDIQNINQSMSNLKAAFDVLEQGRLSGLEVNFAALKTEVNLKASNTARNTAVWFSGIMSLSVSVISALITFFIINK